MEYMTLQQAGEYLGVSKTWMWQAVKSGRIKVFEDPKDKRKKLVSKKDAEEFRKPRPIKPAA